MQGQADGRSGTALLIYPGKSHSPSQASALQASPLIPDFGQDQELYQTSPDHSQVLCCLWAFRATKTSWQCRTKCHSTNHLNKRQSKRACPDLINFCACFSLDLSKMLLLSGFAHSIRGSGNVNSIPPPPPQSCWRK